MTAAFSRLKKALFGEPLPCAVLDVGALLGNVDALMAHVPEGKTLRLATKSIRCTAIVDRIVARAGRRAPGLMTYAATETAFWASRGHGDLLLGYPTVQKSDAALLAEVNAKGAVASVIVDDREQLEPLAHAARERRTTIPVVIEVDMAYRPMGLSHLGVRRSPIREPSDVLAFARKVRETPGLRVHGVMGYEAQIAGIPDHDGSALSPVKRALKRRSARECASRRAEITRALREDGFELALFNGGGTGSLASSAKEACLTELTAGSGFIDSHLFDGFDHVALTPALFFVLQVVRRPAPGMVTCMGGGYVASGGAGKDRLPIPVFPAGLCLLDLEGAGEVQTPLEGARDVALGDPVFFRHAKAGELAEHFDEYLFVEGGLVTSREKTYRGMGQCFLG